MATFDPVEVAKEAHVLAQQLRALHAEMTAAGRNWGSYRACASTYSAHLGRAREILAHDSTIARTIAHLRPYDPFKDKGYGQNFEQIKADLLVLSAALESFFNFHFPAAERQRIGF